MMGYLETPIQVAIELTSGCNQNCVHCFAESYPKSPNDLLSELSFEEIRDLLYELSSMKVFRVVLTGGEPLLRKDFFEILKQCVALRLSPSITTNGTLITKHVAARFGEIDINVGLQISLYGATSEAHNKFVVTDGAFEKSIRGIKNLLTSGITPSVSVTVTKLNYREIPKLTVLVDSLGVRELHVLNLVPSGRGRQIWSSVLNAQEWLWIFNTLCHMSLKMRIIFDLKPYLPVVPSGYLERITADMVQRDFEFVGCPCGRTWCTVLSDGKVTACSYLRDPKFYAGDIRTAPLERIWKESLVLHQWRGDTLYQLDELCRSCRFLDLCRGGCPAAAYSFYGIMRSPDPRCPLAQIMS